MIFPNHCNPFVLLHMVCSGRFEFLYANCVGGSGNSIQKMALPIGGILWSANVQGRVGKGIPSGRCPEQGRGRFIVCIWWC